VGNASADEQGAGDQEVVPAVAVVELGGAGELAEADDGGVVEQRLALELGVGGALQVGDELGEGLEAPVEPVGLLGVPDIGVVVEAVGQVPDYVQQVWARPCLTAW